ncbi:unnamed protein product [Arctogadus glacialis]
MVRRTDAVRKDNGGVDADKIGHVSFVKRWVQPEPDTVVPICVAEEWLVTQPADPAPLKPLNRTLDLREPGECQLTLLTIV